MSEHITISDRAWVPAQVRAAPTESGDRAFEVVWSTGAPVKRYSWDEGYYMEELSMDPKHIRLGRLNAGASFLDTHDQGAMASRLGAVVPGSARIEGGKGIARIFVSTSPAGEQLLADLRSGMPLPVSVGYKTHAYQREDGEEDGEEGGKLPTLRAIDWEPMEISAVPIPADPGAMARGEETSTTTVPIKARGEAAAREKTMSTEDIAHQRADQIMNFSTQHKVPMKLAKRAIDEGKTLAEFRSMALDAIIAEQDRTPTFSVAPSYNGRSDVPLANLLADAMTARIDSSFKPTNGADEFVGLSVAELARRALEARGTGTRGMSQSDLIQRALHTTSDFPTSLTLIGDRQLQKGYAAVPSGIKAIARKVTHRDFRPKANVVLAGGGSLLKVNESGEYKRTTFVEGVEQYALSSFGRIFGITRAALINDDLGVFADLPARFGQMASQFEASFLTTLLEANPKMGDAKAVFHVDHKNLAATGSALSVTSLSEARLAMRKQVDLAGDLIALAPKYLIVPSALETVAEQLLATTTANTPGDVNPFSGKLTLIVEPRLKDQTAWYLAADPDQFSGVEYAYLEGQEGPRLEQRTGFDVDGTEFKVAEDFGAAILDYRGLFKNPGA